MIANLITWKISESEKNFFQGFYKFASKVQEFIVDYKPYLPISFVTTNTEQKSLATQRPPNVKLRTKLAHFPDQTIYDYLTFKSI